MKLRSLWLVLALLMTRVVFAIDHEAAFPDVERQARYDHIVHQLRCLVCQNETIADSGVDLAADLRNQVREMIKSGRSDEDIYKYMTDRYGDFVLYNPPVEPRTWLLWAAPVLFVLIGLSVAGIIIMRRSRLSSDTPDTLDSDTGVDPT
jgi:cytochrome c-type biogenesis protein CcmH